MDIDSPSTLQMGGSSDEASFDSEETYQWWRSDPNTVPDILLPFMAITKYNGILARQSIRRCRRTPSIPYHLVNVGLDLPEEVPPMPKEIKKLMYNGIPIGSRQMHNAMTNEPYLKFHGLKEKVVKKIAGHLICIPHGERKDIMERMMLNCRVAQLHKIIEQYQNAARNLARKNKKRVRTGQPIVCDQLGTIH